MQLPPSVVTRGVQVITSFVRARSEPEDRSVQIRERVFAGKAGATTDTLCILSNPSCLSGAVADTPSVNSEPSWPVGHCLPEVPHGSSVETDSQRSGV